MLVLNTATNRLDIPNSGFLKGYGNSKYIFFRLMASFVFFLGTVTRHHFGTSDDKNVPPGTPKLSLAKT